VLEIVDQTIDIRTARGVVRPVDHVSFDLARGATLGIVGESGSGKSMLVRSILGLVPRNAVVHRQSRIRFDGLDPAQLPREERRHFLGTRVAMVFQDPMTSLNPVRTIGAHLIDPMKFHLKLDRAALKSRALALLEQVGISDPMRRLRQYPHELSGGMRQRVMIAIALSCDPELLVADEPTTALDVTVQRQILDLLADLRRERAMSMILVSHDVAVIASQADRVAVMYAGRFVEEVPGEALLDEARHPYTVALLASRPSRDHPRRERLTTIGGRPPDLYAPTAGCAFAPRCTRASDECSRSTPNLDVIGGQHRAACFHPVDVDAARRSPRLTP
jgi:oligopeptide/dipeptide ABC transporter ATP-binding protein